MLDKISLQLLVRHFSLSHLVLCLVHKLIRWRFWLWSQMRDVGLIPLQISLIWHQRWQHIIFLFGSSIMLTWRSFMEAVWRNLAFLFKSAHMHIHIQKVKENKRKQMCAECKCKQIANVNVVIMTLKQADKKHDIQASAQIFHCWHI